PRLKYDEGGQKNYIPTNLRLGAGLDVIFDANNSLNVNLEFNKLLVPSPVAVYENDQFQGYQQPDITFLKGIFESFNDAPGGLNEELKEITWATGVEYVFQDTFALRTGYFNESLEKGSRRFLTLGAGFRLDFATIDISYLFSTSKIRNPLENTLRFSLTFNLSGQPEVLSSASTQ
ncbi:MAG: PorV/PorQ family protein, partial [Flavobacteriaceae bacterium]